MGTRERCMGRSVMGLSEVLKRNAQLIKKKAYFLDVLVQTCALRD